MSEDREYRLLFSGKQGRILSFQETGIAMFDEEAYLMPDRLPIYTSACGEYASVVTTVGPDSLFDDVLDMGAAGKFVGFTPHGKSPLSAMAVRIEDVEKLLTMDFAPVEALQAMALAGKLARPAPTAALSL